MDVLKFKSKAGGVETYRYYALSQVKSITHTVAPSGIETLSIDFGVRTEITRDIDDIKKVLKQVKAIDANKNEVDKAEAAMKEKADARDKARIAEENRVKAEIKKSEAIKAKIAKKRLSKKPASKKATKKVTKKKAKKKSKKKIAKI